MDRSFARVDRKPEASTGKHSQAEMPLLGPVRTPHVLDEAHLAHITFSGALNEAAKLSGLDDYAIADEIPVSHGYMSRFMRGLGEQWARRTVRFMHITNSRAPAQWIASQVGCDLVQRDEQAAEIERLRLQLAAAERRRMAS